MQTVAAYLLERRVFSAEQRAEERRLVLDAMNAWLLRKGGELDVVSGNFRSKSHGAEATFAWKAATDAESTWDYLELTETDSAGVVFETGVSLTCGDLILVYLTLKTGVKTKGLSPVPINPHCPHIVRTLLEFKGDWFHGATKFLRPQRLTGADGGDWLAGEVRSQLRRLPILVISEVDGEPALETLLQQSSRDLSGLANVFAVDDGASWELTKILGKEWSCYNGAIRLYWPGMGDSPARHPTWTLSRLFSRDETPLEAERRIRKQLRRMLMGASVLSVERPSTIDEIRLAPARRRLATLAQEAESKEDFKSLASMYEEENDELRRQCSRLEETNAELRAKLEGLELSFQYVPREEDDIAPARADEVESDAPGEGEIRFYKKTHSSRKFDVLKRVGDCNHSAWEGATKADKAKKGIARFEGRDDWKSIQHCATCTGGGMWRVKW